MQPIDLRTGPIRTSRSRVLDRAVLPVKFWIPVYLLEERAGKRKLQPRKISTYRVTALTPNGANYFLRELRRLIGDLDQVQLIPPAPAAPAGGTRG